MAAVLGGAILLSGCDGANMPSFLQGKDTADAQTSVQSGATRLVERDVEAPGVFQMSESGLWDGRPSLGGVWVAHPDTKDPERVIIRNEANGKFVIGALFRRERDVPGPRFQVSSDAAAALGMLAGQPAQLNVTALRREEIPQEPAAQEPATDTAAAPEAIAEGTLDPIAAAAAALDEAEGIAPPVVAPPAATPSPAAAPTQAASLAKPFIQIGIFSVEANAMNTAQALRGAGMVPTVRKGASSGKSFWRVIVGPTTSSSERATLLKKIKNLGFSDAYFVTN